MRASKQKGFTIVELLVVIVVIAVLAAVTVVAYNGIQNRANNSVVQSDLREISTRISMFEVENSQYPSNVQLSTMSPLVKFSRNSYMTSNNAVLYCSAADGSTYALIGKASSGITYYITNTNKTPQVFPSTFPHGMAVDCPVVGQPPTGGMWIHTSASGWLSWAV